MSTLRPHKIKQYGWRPDLPDFRDQKFSLPRAVMMPPSVDLEPQCPPIVDQGQLGSCTANAIGAALHFDALKQGLPNPFSPSRLFIYYCEREIEGTTDTDAGASIRDGIKSVAQLGAPPEDPDWPYDISKFAVKPSDLAYGDALLHLSVQYGAIDQDKTVMQQSLANGFPFVIGFSVYDSFESNDVTITGDAPMPGKDENLLGGHAVLCVGYDDSSSRWKLRNSWGPNWGKHGYFTLPYEYLTNQDLSSDFWVIQLVK